jgi:hypothetical protein
VTRFVIDEVSWSDLEPGQLAAPAAQLVSAIERKLERVAAIRDSGQAISKHSSIYEAEVAGQTLFFDLLYGPDYAYLGRDLRLRLMVAIDQTPNWDADFAPADIHVTIDGRTFEAPSIVVAWENLSAGAAVACVPLDCIGRHGPVPVNVGGDDRTVHFVTTDSEQAGFFRDAIEIEDADEDGFAALASSTFPALDWADGVWGGLSEFSRPFRDVRADVTQHLSVLNDHGAGVFHAFSANGSDEVAARLSALGATASDENGRTKRNRDCEKDRTRFYRGREVTFWWHTKLEPNVDRIHFLYIPGPNGSPGVVVVGIFTEHCRLLD